MCTNVCLYVYWDVESCVLVDVLRDMCVYRVEWVYIVVCCVCLGAQMLGMCASVLGCVRLGVRICVHVFVSLFVGGGCGVRCVCTALSAGQGCLRCAHPLVQKAFPCDQEGRLPMNLRSCKIASPVTCRQSSRRRTGKELQTWDCVLS